MFEKITVENVRNQVIRSLKTKGIKLPIDCILREEVADFTYIQNWISKSKQKIFIASVQDVRIPNCPIEFKEKLLQ